MAKWILEERRFFLSQFDGVQYVIPCDKSAEWIKWMCSNEPTLPDYATAYVSGHMTFTDPRHG